MEHKEYSNNTLFLAISGLLFFGILIKRTNKSELNHQSPEEKNFITQRCNIGIFLLGILIIFGLLYLLSTKTGVSIFYNISEILGHILLTIIIVSLPLLISGYTPGITTLNQNALQKKQMILSFLPIWNDYKWFNIHNFETPYWRLKEGQLRLMIILASLIIFRSSIPTIVLVTILSIRVFLLILGKDIINQESKIRINKTFKVTPLEIIPNILKIITKKVIKGDKEGLKIKIGNSKIKTIYLCFYLTMIIFCIWSLRYTKYRGKIIPLIWLIIRGILIVKYL